MPKGKKQKRLLRLLYLAHLSLRPLFVGWTTVTYAHVFVGGRIVAASAAGAAGVVPVGKSLSPALSVRLAGGGGGGRMRKELRERTTGDAPTTKDAPGQACESWSYGRPERQKPLTSPLLLLTLSKPPTTSFGDNHVEHTRMGTHCVELAWNLRGSKPRELWEEGKDGANSAVETKF